MPLLPPTILNLSLQLEVLHLAALPDQEGIALGWVFRGRLAGDRAVLDRPEFLVAAPAFERLAVKQRLDAFLFVGPGQAGKSAKSQTSPPESRSFS